MANNCLKGASQYVKCIKHVEPIAVSFSHVIFLNIFIYILINKSQIFRNKNVLLNFFKQEVGKFLSTKYKHIIKFLNYLWLKINFSKKFFKINTKMCSLHIILSKFNELSNFDENS